MLLLHHNCKSCTCDGVACILSLIKTLTLTPFLSRILGQMHVRQPGAYLVRESCLSIWYAIPSRQREEAFWSTAAKDIEPLYVCARC